MVQFYGTVLNTVKMAQLDNKWMQKKEELNNGNLTQMTAVERMVYQYEEQCRDMRESEAENELYNKVASGQELTPEEIAYLKKNNPTAYQDYLDAREEKESYKRRLRDCETKEDVEKLKFNELSKFMAAAKKTESNPNISKEQKLAIMQKILQRVFNIQEEHLEFVKSAQYSNLPDDMEEKEARKEGVSNEEYVENEEENVNLSVGNEDCGNGDVPVSNNSDKTAGLEILEKPDNSGKNDKEAVDFKNSVSEIKTIINEVKSEAKKIDMKV